MTTESLIDYIKKELNKNVSKELITSRLSGVGWHMDDIEEGFSKAVPVSTADLSVPPLVINEVKNIYKVTPSQGQINNLDSFSPSTSLEPKEIATEKVEPIKNDEIFKEVPKIISKAEPEIKNEVPPKVWIPRTIKPVDNSPSSFITNKLEPFKYELEDKETMPTLNQKPKETPVPEKIKDVVADQAAPIYKPESVPVKKIDSNIEDYNNKDIFKLNINNKENKMEDTTNKNTSTTIKDPVLLNVNTENKDIFMNIPKKAMISSYSQDYMSANKLQQEVSQRKKSGIFKWLLVLLVIIALGGLVFAFLKGYIKLPKINSSLIKKDPKTILLENVNKFDSLTSYKVKKEVTISLPLFSNITSGLMSGGNVSSSEKEFFSYKVDGRVNKNSNVVSFFDYDITLNSSMLKNEIKTNIKSNGVDSFITIPNLSDLFDHNTPPEGVVLIPNKQIDQINVIIPEDVKEKINNIDLTKMIPDGNSDILSNKISSKDLIDNFDFIKVGNEKIYDIETEHYSVSMDNESLQKILNGILETIPVTSSLDQTTSVSGNFSAVSIKSIDFWIGKKDENIYKYKFSLTIPLSKVLGLDDKSIANSEVSFDVETTFHDFNNFNQAVLPSSFMYMDEFSQKISDIKVKNTVSAFTPLANEMKNALGSYGTKSNSTGSCIKPASGSIFSPLGHTKGASTAVGKIADAMNSIVDKLSGDPQCFSTSKAWAISSSLVSDANKYFCIDSVGNSIILDKPLSTTVCQ